MEINGSGAQLAAAGKGKLRLSIREATAPKKTMEERISRMS